MSTPNESGAGDRLDDEGRLVWQGLEPVICRDDFGW